MILDRVYKAYVYVMYFFILIPLIIIVGTSFSTSQYVTFPPEGFSLKWFVRVLTSYSWMFSFFLSAVIALVSMGIAILVSLPAAKALAKHRVTFLGRDVGVTLRTLFLSPIVIPMIVFGIGIAITLQTLGLYGTFPGLVIGHLIIVVPYVLRSLIVSFEGIPDSVEEAAITLGATPIKTFFKVTLPMAKSGLIAGSLFAFIWSFENVTVSIFLAVPGMTPLPIKMWGYLSEFADPSLCAVATIFIVVAFGVFLTIYRKMGKASMFAV
jgi:putative spermidine/putrescine transport system permease protein